MSYIDIYKNGIKHTLVTTSTIPAGTVILDNDDSFAVVTNLATDDSTIPATEENRLMLFRDNHARLLRKIEMRNKIPVLNSTDWV